MELFRSISWCNITSMCSRGFYVHLMGDKSKAQRGELTCSKVTELRDGKGDSPDWCWTMRGTFRKVTEAPWQENQVMGSSIHRWAGLPGEVESLSLIVCKHGLGVLSRRLLGSGLGTHGRGHRIQQREMLLQCCGHRGFCKSPKEFWSEAGPIELNCTGVRALSPSTPVPICCSKWATPGRKHDCG